MIVYIRLHRRIEKDRTCPLRTLPRSTPDGDTYTEPAGKRTYKVEKKVAIEVPKGKLEGVRLTYDNGGRGGCTSSAEKETVVLVAGIGPAWEYHYESALKRHQETWELVTFEKAKK